MPESQTADGASTITPLDGLTPGSRPIHPTMDGGVTQQAPKPWERPILIGAVLAAQMAVLVIAWWSGTHTVSASEVVASSTERATLTAEGTAAGVATAIARAGIATLDPGTDDLDRAQSIIEQLHLPGKARPSIVDADGSIICHPRLDATGAGRRLTPRETSIVATAPLPKLNARVVVTSPALEGAAGFASQSVPLGAKLLTFGVSLLSITAIGVVALISLHGRRLEAANARLSREMRSQAAAVLRTRDGMIYGLAKLADYRDSDTGHHLDRICRYAVMLAEQMSTDRPEIDGPFIANLRLAASLHDIGKVGIPDRVLLKPGKLDDAERAIVERHAVIGASTLLSIRRRVGDDALLDMSIDIALRHHERWDGGGYPDGVSGEEIPLSARLVAVADVYDALTCERVYKPAMPHDQARTIIEEGAGAHFDPCVVEAFVEVADEFDAARRSLQPPKRLAA